MRSSAPASTSGSRRPQERSELLKGLKIDLPDTKESLDILKILLQDRDEIERAKKAAQERRAAHQQDDDHEQMPDQADAALHAKLQALQEEAELSSRAEDYLETEQVLFPAEPEEPALELHGDPFIDAATQAHAALGLGPLPDGGELGSANAGGDSDVADAVFRHAVASGVIASQVAATGSCSKPRARALFSLMAYSSDLDVASAAFYTLLLALGQAWPVPVWLDAAPFALPTPRTAINTMGIPSMAAILDALAANGFGAKRTERAPPRGKGPKDGHDRSTGDLAAAAAAAAAAAEEHQQGLVPGLRIQTVKLLLHTAVAVCRHTAAHPKTAAAGAAVECGSVGDLLLVVLHMGLDPAALLLQPDLDIVVPALAAAFDAKDWERTLPQLAEKLATLGPSPRACFRILLQLGAAAGSADSKARSRCMQLQRYAGCILAGKIIPGGAASSNGGMALRGGLPDPTEVLPAQPWFKKPKALINGAVSAAAAARSRDGYTISDVELLLRACNMLLWPSAIAAWAGSPGGDGGGGDGWAPEMLSNQFVKQLCGFLSGIHRTIKVLQPEDQAVKAFANKMEMQYQDMTAGAGDFGSLSPMM